MKFRIILILFFTLSFFFVNSQNSKTPKFGKGLFNLVGQDSSWAMKIGARMQFLTTSNWTENESNASSFLVRRARLKFDGFALSPKLTYKLELGLSNIDISGGSEHTSNSPRYILDAVVKWNFHDNFVLWFGQAKLPGNRERVVSSANLQLVDRSLLNLNFNIDRDLGIQLRHHFNLTDKFIVREVIAFSQGEGRNVTGGNLGGYQYTGRIELLPLGNFKANGDYIGSDLEREQTPKIAIGATYDFNNNAVRSRSNLGTYMLIDDEQGFYETNISTFFIDMMFKYNGVSFMGEYAYRDADDPFAKNSDGTLTGDIVQVGNGLNLQAGYLLTSNWEVSGRYTNIKLDKNITGENIQNQYTIGLSKYIAGHSLKVQTDISYLEHINNNKELMYRLQFDVHF